MACVVSFSLPYIDAPHLNVYVMWWHKWPTMLTWVTLLKFGSLATQNPRKEAVSAIFRHWFITFNSSFPLFFLLGFFFFLTFLPSSPAGVVEGDLAAVEAYKSSGGDIARQLTADEVQLLNRSSAFDVGFTLVHLAIRFQRQDMLAILLTEVSIVLNLWAKICHKFLILRGFMSVLIKKILKILTCL